MQYMQTITVYLFIPDSGPAAIFRRGNEILSGLAHWASSDGIIITVKKTKAIMLRSKEATAFRFFNLSK